MTLTRRLAIGDLLAALALMLAAAASAAGLALPELYRDGDAMVAQARGTDLATLAIAVPILALALWRARAGSLAAHMVVLGMLGYLVYAYAIFAFQVVIGPATPVHIAVLGLASWALALRLPVIALAATAGIGARLPRRTAAAFLGLIAVAFGGLWLSEIAGAITSGVLPVSVSDLDLPTSAVYTLDLAFLLPAMLVALALLLRRHPAGRPTALALLAFSLVMVLSIIGLFAFQAMDGMAVDVAMLVVFGVIGLASALLAWIGARGVHGSESTGSAPAARSTAGGN